MSTEDDINRAETHAHELAAQDEQNPWATLRHHWNTSRAREAEDPNRQPDAAEAFILKTMSAAYGALRNLGWREKIYMPTDVLVRAIPPNGGGIVLAKKSDTGTVWLHEAGDLWPGDVLLFKPLQPADTEKGPTK